MRFLVLAVLLAPVAAWAQVGTAPPLNPQPVADNKLPTPGSGTDASNAQPAVGNVLATFTVTQPGAYYVQNQSGADLTVVYDNGTSGGSTQILQAASAAGKAGQDTSPPMAWFTGRIRVTGAAGSQFMARGN